MQPFEVKYAVGTNYQMPQIIAILAASFASISNGLLMAWPSPSIPNIMKDNSSDITFEEASYFSVIPPIAMVITAPLISMLIDKIGRKMGVLLVAVPQLTSWILIACFKDLWIIYLSRFISGIGDALLYAAMPVYVCEISEPSVRGAWATSVPVNICFGIFLINLIGAYNNISRTAAICSIFPCMHILLFYFMPESPYFYLMKNRESAAANSLRRLRWRNDIEEELEKLKTDVKRQISETGSMKELFTIGSNRRALVLSVGMRLAQQLSGLAAFEIYTQYMFQEAGGYVSDKMAAIIFTGILVIAEITSTFFVEKFGRRPLMLVSTLGCALVLSIETVYFVIKQFTAVDLTPHFGWLPLTGMIVYTVMCAVGLGILPLLITGEIFSASIKGKATAIMNVVIATCFLTVPKLFHYLTFKFGIFSSFLLFSTCCYASSIFSYVYVIETKGKTLEEIQQELKGNKIM